MNGLDEKEIQKKLEEFEKELFEGDLFGDGTAESAPEAPQAAEEEDFDKTDTIPFDEVVLKTAEETAQRIREEEELKRAQEAQAEENDGEEEDFDTTDTLPFDEVVSASAGAELYEDYRRERGDRRPEERRRRRAAYDTDRDYAEDEYLEEMDDIDRDDAYDEEEEEEGNALVRFFSRMSAIDWAISAAAAAIVLAGVLFLVRMNQTRQLEAQAAEFKGIGQQIEGIEVIGGDTLHALSDARIAQAEAAEAAKIAAEEEQKAAEIAALPGIPVDVKLSTIQSDLKLKFLNKEKNAMIAGAPFRVEVVRPSGKTETWEDDDKDGIIYRDGLENGEYKVTALALAQEGDKKYDMPSGAQSIKVTDTIAYQKVDVSDEIKKESEINVAQEDTAKKDTVVESTIQDTVEWVESTKTLIGEGEAGYAGTSESYEEIGKDQITDPYAAASRIFQRPYVYLTASDLHISGTDHGTAGSSAKFNAEITVAEGTEGHGEVSWFSDNDSVAKVDSNGNVTFVGAGTATIQALCDGVSDVMTVTVEGGQNGEGQGGQSEGGGAVTGVTLSGTMITGKAGESRVLTANVQPQDAADKSVSWSSSDTGVATVDGGTVRLIAPGTATITVTTAQGGYKAECSVTVEKNEGQIVAVSGVSLNRDSLTGDKGGGETLTATVSPDNATNKKVSWKSSDTAVASVDGSGKVTYVGKGKATITVTTEDGGKQASCSVTVNGAADENARLKDKNGNPLYVKDGDTYREALVKDYRQYDRFYRKKVSSGQYRYTGWQTLDGRTYFFDKNGNYVTGEQIIQGATYHFDGEGILQTGDTSVGIDVSTWNGGIDWNAVRSSGISFAIIRCGYRGSSVGALVEDSRFRTNITGARNAGLKVGVYFFSQAVTEAEAVEEASMVIQLISGYGVNLPVFLDVESSGGRGDRISADQRTKNIRAFCQTIRNSGYSAGVYANTNWFSEKIHTGSLTDYNIWLAQYSAAPTYTRTRYDIWQYSSTGRVSGISGNVDMNISYRAY
ncbi:MAG: Ig-like domain-containing protein [Lachnospiraceae bacterium]|nr:Ig-like domain-containing protein [Lachnospiraceae bacterium]